MENLEISANPVEIDIKTKYFLLPCRKKIHRKYNDKVIKKQAKISEETKIPWARKLGQIK
jgi:hypothetical protein